MFLKPNFYKLIFAIVLAFSTINLAMPPQLTHAQSITAEVVYIVRQGDTLYRIAQNHGTTVAAIKQLNQLMSDTIYVGQRLIISGNPSPIPPGSFGYTVRPGDTLYRIAQRHGTTVAAVKQANNLVSDAIYVGQRLTIPGTEQPIPTDLFFYTVQRGDTLSVIARRYNTSVAAIKQANSLVSDTIYVGQRLAIPTIGNTPPNPIWYTVQRGDTLSAIARRYGTSVPALYAANSLTSDRIYVGQRLFIPT